MTNTDENTLTDFSNLTDEEVVKLSKNNNSYATDFILNKYKNFVRAKARTYFLIGADREDIVQEGMIGLYKAIRDFKEEKLPSFKSFAELCITRQIITAIKTATRQKHIPLNSYISLNKPIYDEDEDRTLMDTIIKNKNFDPEEIMINKEHFDFIEEKMHKVLSKLEWNVLNLYLSGKSYAEIAKHLEKSEKSIDNALQRIKRKVEKFMSEK